MSSAEEGEQCIIENMGVFVTCSLLNLTKIIIQHI